MNSTATSSASDLQDWDELWRPSKWNSRPSDRPSPSFSFWLLIVGAVLVADVLGNVILDGLLQIPIKAVVTIALLFWAHKDGLSWQDLGFDSKRLKRGIRFGLYVAAAVVALFAIALLIPSTRDSLADARIVSGTSDRLLKIFVEIPIGTAIFEETIFRGVIFGAILHRHEVKVALFAQAILFGLWHIVPATSNANGSALSQSATILGTVLFTTLAGIAFGWARLRANSTLAPIIAHGCINIGTFVAVVIAIKLT